MTKDWRFGRDAIHLSVFVEFFPLITFDNGLRPKG